MFFFNKNPIEKKVIPCVISTCVILALSKLNHWLLNNYLNGDNVYFPSWEI